MQYFEEVLSICIATFVGIVAMKSFRTSRRVREIEMHNTFRASLTDTLPHVPSTPDRLASPAVPPAPAAQSFALDRAAIAESALNVRPPTPAEQAIWDAAVADMWRAAEVGYAEHLLLLLQRLRVPADYTPARGNDTLLITAASVRTQSASHDRDLSAVLRLLLGRGARVAHAQHSTGATALHLLVEQPQEFKIAARLKALLIHVGAAPGGAGSALEVADGAGRLPEDVAAEPQVRGSLVRLRVMIDLRARR